MKKLRLLSIAFMACTAICASAQTTGPKSTSMRIGEEYYLYNVEAGAFFNQGNNWGTRASIKTNEGLKVRFTKNGDYYKFNDQKNDGGWNALDCDGNWDSWVDGNGRGGDGQWSITPIDGGNSFKLSNTVPGEGKYFSVIPSKNDTKLYFSDASEAQSEWIAVSSFDYSKFIGNNFIYTYNGSSNQLLNCAKYSDVTKTYLVEGSNFSRSDEPTGAEYSRFGFLGEPWIVSENIFNQGGKGGYDTWDNSMCISVEKWNSSDPAIANGYIYQTTKAELPAGVYTLNVHSFESSIGGDDGYVLCAVAGADFLNGTVLGQYDMHALNGGRPWGDGVCEFTLTEPTTVSIGWKVNLPDGWYSTNMRVNELQLYSENDDITDEYLSNCSYIQRKDEPISAKYNRFGTPKYWESANFSISGGNGTKEGIDNAPGYNCLQLEKWDGDAAAEGIDLSQSILYKKVTLPEGKYYFGSKYQYSEGNSFNIFVAEEPLTADNVSNAIAYADQHGRYDNNFYGVEFELTEETEVYLGWNSDMTTFRTSIRISEVILAYAPTVNDIAATIASANAIKDEAMESTVKANLLEKLAAAEAVAESTEKDVVNPADEALFAAITAANASIELYEAIATALATYDLKASNLDENGQATYGEGVSSIRSGYTAGTLTTDQTAAIAAAYIAGVRAQTTEGSDFTPVVKNADCASIDEWSISIEDGGFHLNTWSVEGNSDGTNMTTPFIEYYKGANNALLNSTISHSQITGLATGKYKITILARIYTEGTSTDANPGTLKFFANDATLNVNTGNTVTFNNLHGYFGTYEITTTVSEAGTLDFGFVIDNSPFTWLSFKNATLTFVRALGEIDAAKEILEATLASAEAIKDEVMTASIKSDLLAKIYAAKTAADSEDKDVITTANTDLSESINVATLSIAAYDALASAITPYADSENEDIANAYAAAQTVYSAATMTTEEVNAYISTFKHNVYFATAESPYTGAELAAGTFYLYNAEAGKFLQGSNDYGTRASLTHNGQAVILEQDGEGYFINTQIENGDNHWLNNEMWMDAGRTKYVFEAIGNNFYTIRQDGTSNYMKYDGDDGYRVNLNYGETNGSYWQLVTADDIKAAAQENANREKPFEVTSLINDANFSRSNKLKSSWSMGSECGNKNLGGGEQYNFCGESWRSAFTLAQTLTSMPNGIYKMTCQAFENPYDGNPQGAYIYANESRGEILTNTTGLNSMGGASAAFTDGQYVNEPVTFVVTDGTVTMGIKETRNTSWVIFDNFRLYYLGKADSVSMKISETAHYGTFIAPFDVTLPEGIEAYGCSSVNGEVLELTSMNGTIPANTPVIVYSENEVNQTFRGISTAEADEYTIGLLTGVYVEQAAPVDSYVLQDHDGVLKFYIVDDSYYQPTIYPNRCYLTVAGTEIKSFGFDFADAIKNININKNANETIYNLAGQAVDSNYKGIVIKNGKKVLVK